MKKFAAIFAIIAYIAYLAAAGSSAASFGAKAFDAHAAALKAVATE